MNDNLTDIRKMFLFPRIFMTLMIKYDSVYGIIVASKKLSHVKCRLIIARYKNRTRTGERNEQRYIFDC